MSSTSGAFTRFEPVLVTLEPRPAAVVRFEVGAAGLPDAVAAAIGEARATIRAEGLAPTGAPFARYLSWGPEMVVAEAGFPVSTPFRVPGHVVAGCVPGGRIATAMHDGPYETIGATYGRLDAWIRAAGLTPGGTMWEVYRRGAADDPDPATWRTQVFWPID